MTKTAICSLALLLLAGCAGDDLDENAGNGTVDSQVVVQETNLPPLPCAAPGSSYVQELTRACTGAEVEVSLCAPVALCDAQLTAIYDQVSECESDGPFEMSELPSCP